MYLKIYKFNNIFNYLKYIKKILNNSTLYGFKFKEFPQFLTSLTDLKYMLVYY